MCQLSVYTRCVSNPCAGATQGALTIRIKKALSLAASPPPQAPAPEAEPPAAQRGGALVPEPEPQPQSGESLRSDVYSKFEGGFYGAFATMKDFRGGLLVRAQTTA
eukprot:SAG11_NODE_5209_length_1630_cov_1.399086_3_plen_106_part_00